MSYCRFLISCCAVWFAPIGCGPAPGSGSSSWFVSGTPDAGSGNASGWIGHQGRLLQGFQNPDIRGFKLTAAPHAHVIDGGELVADGLAGRDFVGLAFDAGGGGDKIVTMRIADVFPPDQTGGTWQYAIEQQDPGTGSWAPACAEPLPIVPPDDPPVSPPRAIAMNGAWESNGVYLVNADTVSFSCSTGAIAKCAEWGYPVTATPPSLTEHGLPVTVTGADLAQACARMARADFCEIGVSNTLEGTPILFDDIFRTPPNTTGYAFEAAWPGIASTGGPPPQTPAICLSKLRWSTLPFGGGCGLPIPDPRVDAKGEFCDDLTPEQLEQAGALVYSWSSFLDAGLYSYVIPSTAIALTTSNLVPGAVGELPAWKVPPPVPLSFPATGENVRFEATIFAPQLPSHVPQAGLLMLSTYSCGSDLVTTTSPPAAGCTKIADEGKVYAPNTPGHTPLRRWTDATGHHPYTTAISPSAMIARGMRLAEVVGGVLRASIDLNVRWSSLAGATTSLDVQTRTGEWIAPCIPSVGSAHYTYTGLCTADNRAVDRSSIAALRINYTTASGTVSATTAYDDADSDVYVALPGGTTTAVAVTWNERAPGARYALSIQRTPGTWSRCIDSNLLANGTSHVFTGACSSTGLTFSLQSILRLRVCTNIGGTDFCGEVPYDGIQSRVAIAIP